MNNRNTISVENLARREDLIRWKVLANARTNVKLSTRDVRSAIVKRSIWNVFLMNQDLKTTKPILTWNHRTGVLQVDTDHHPQKARSLNLVHPRNELREVCSQANHVFFVFLVPIC